MTRVTHICPIEAIRQGATVDGAVALARLAAEGAEYQPNAVVELFPAGWVATVVYSKPGHPGRTSFAHIGLAWAPVESAAAQGVAS